MFTPIDFCQWLRGYLDATKPRPGSPEHPNHLDFIEVELGRIFAQDLTVEEAVDCAEEAMDEAAQCADKETKRLKAELDKALLDLQRMRDNNIRGQVHSQIPVGNFIPNDSGQQKQRPGCFNGLSDAMWDE